MPRSRALRVLRGTLAASVATFVALLSHMAAGGSLPAVVGVLAPWVLSIAVCTVLAGRKLSFARLAIAVSVSQVLFHSLFAVGGPSGAASSTAIGHSHHAELVISASGAAAVDPWMWAAHAIAALITIAAIYRGEAAVVRLVAVAKNLLAKARRRIRILPATPRVPAYRPRLTPQLLQPLGWVPALTPRRGPPALSA